MLIHRPLSWYARVPVKTKGKELNQSLSVSSNYSVGRKCPLTVCPE